MRVLLSILLALCLLQSAYSQCADGTFTNPTIINADKGACVGCREACATCTTVSACTEYKSSFSGIDRATTPGTLYCSGSSMFGSLYGYNKAKDYCDYCIEGCETCVIDYDYCIKCRVGWDYDRTQNKCIRATLGLAAVVLALSALFLILAVITCICACKL